MRSAVCSERTGELPPNVGTGAPRAAAKTEESEVWEIAQLLLTLLSFSEDEAAEAKPACPPPFCGSPQTPATHGDIQEEGHAGFARA
jgi:hypothetical protein